MTAKVVFIEKIGNVYYIGTETGFLLKVDNTNKKIVWRLKTKRGRNFVMNPISIVEKNGLIFVAERTQIQANISAIVSSMKIDERGIVLEEITILDEPFSGAGIGNMQLLDNGKLQLSCSFLNTFAEFSVEEKKLTITESFSGDGDYDSLIEERRKKYALAANELPWLADMGYDLTFDLSNFRCF